MAKTRRQTLAKHPAIRILIAWTIHALALVILTFLLRGLRVDSVGVAFAAAAVIGLLNAVLWPLLSYVLLPLAVFTLGLVALVLNGVIVWLAGRLVPGFDVANLWTAVWTALGMTAINLVASGLLTIDDDVAFYRHAVRRRARRIAAPETDVPGVLFLEIDGLGKPMLERALSEGHMPTLARWLESKSHRLVGWETDLSSQTSASQAGILHGSNENMPAFRWYDRARKQIVASSDLKEVARMESDRSDGNGLLADGGASRNNMFSGDAPSVMNTASTITDLSRFQTIDFYTFFAHPYNAARTLLLLIEDIILEKVQYRRARRQGVQPLTDVHKRGGVYPLLRGVTNVLMRELNVYALIGDMLAGVPSVYATFVGYDEVAHHSGSESPDASDVLFKLDQQFARLERAAEDAPRPYRFVILSDHGQCTGATFEQRYHVTLEELVQQLAEEHRVQGAPDVHEDWKHVNVLLGEATRSERKVVSRPLARLLRGRTVEGEVRLGPEGKARKEEGEEEEQEGIVTLASGSLGLVYASELDERATLEQIEAYSPGLLDGLAAHEGIGFLMVRSAEHGPVVIGAQGRHYLGDDRVEGEDPLAAFGPRAADHLRREDGFVDAPDILVSSVYDAESGEMASFEGCIGSHGGLGGAQTQPFVMFPAEWPLPEGDLVGAASVYELFKGWLAQLKAAGEAERPAETTP